MTNNATTSPPSASSTSLSSSSSSSSMKPATTTSTGGIIERRNEALTKLSNTVRSSYLSPLLKIHNNQNASNSDHSSSYGSNNNTITYQDLISSYEETKKAIDDKLSLLVSNDDDKMSLWLQEIKKELEVLHQSQIDAYIEYFKRNVLPFWIMELVQKYSSGSDDEMTKKKKKKDDDGGIVVEESVLSYIESCLENSDNNDESGNKAISMDSNEIVCLDGWHLPIRVVEESLLQPLRQKYRTTKKSAVQKINVVCEVEHGTKSSGAMAATDVTLERSTGNITTCTDGNDVKRMQDMNEAKHVAMKGSSSSEITMITIAAAPPLSLDANNNAVSSSTHPSPVATGGVAKLSSTNTTDSSLATATISHEKQSVGTKRKNNNEQEETNDDEGGTPSITPAAINTVPTIAAVIDANTTAETNPTQSIPTSIHDNNNCSISDNDENEIVDVTISSDAESSTTETITEDHDDDDVNSGDNNNDHQEENSPHNEEEEDADQPNQEPQIEVATTVVAVAKKKPKIQQQQHQKNNKRGNKGNKDDTDAAITTTATTPNNKHKQQQQNKQQGNKKKQVARKTTSAKSKQLQQQQTKKRGRGNGGEGRGGGGKGGAASSGRGRGRRSKRGASES